MYQGTLAAVSNRQDWVVDGEITDPETGDLVDLTDATIVVFVCREATPDCAVLTASTGNGKVEITGAGSYTFSFTPAEMASLCGGQTYSVFVRVTLSTGVTYQLLAAQLPVIEGGPAS